MLFATSMCRNGCSDPFKIILRSKVLYKYSAYNSVIWQSILEEDNVVENT